MADFKEEARNTLHRAQEKAGDILDSVKEKTAPVVKAVRDKIDDLTGADAPGLDIHNELFDELEKKAENGRGEAQARADEMQKKLEELMKGL